MRRALVIVADTTADRTLLVSAIEAAATAGAEAIETLIPFVVPATLPIGAQPPRAAAALNALRATAVDTLWRLGLGGRAEIVPCRSLPALVRAAGTPDHVVVAGRLTRSLRRALDATDSEVTALPTSARRRITLPRRPRLAGALTPTGTTGRSRP